MNSNPYILLRRLACHLPAAAAALCIGMGGCSSDECYDNRNSLPLAGFYSSNDSLQRAIQIDSVSILGLGAPGDSVLHDSVRHLAETYLPFRIDTTSTTYVIRYLQGELGRHHIADTVTFSYDPEPWFVSAACGVSYRYVMKRIANTHYVIDSVVCPKGVIDNVSGENLRIYFRTSGEGTEQ